MAKVRIEIEIAATPEQVRAMVLDFPKYPEWHTAFIKFIATVPPTKPAEDLQSGDIIQATFAGSSSIMELTISSNTESRFSWKASVFMGAFSGEHYFEFLPSKSVPGECTLIHGEEYDGWITFIFGEGPFGIARKMAVDNYTGFSQDVKRRVERAQRRLQIDSSNVNT